MPGKASSIPDFTGRVVAGRYQFVRMLGSGAYGAVYEAVDKQARDEKSSRRAIKVVRTDGLTDSEVDNLTREIKLHSVLSNEPNVPTLHQAFGRGHYVYMVMDFIPGGDLFARILDAVQACHRKHIYHRDLKPENILCGEDGSVYLADFGLATSRPTSSTYGCGTSPYLSPENIGADFGRVPYCPKANDVWALGVILVNMITSRSPWARAEVKDGAFNAFRVDGDFLRDTLPISKDANKLLKRIFRLEAEGRISIPKIREAVLELGTFYMTEKEVANATESVKLTWGDFKLIPVKEVASRIPPRANSQDEKPVLSPVSGSGVIGRSTVPEISSPGSLSAASTADSDDSEGPRTPVHAVTIPSLEVPDLCEEQDLGDSALLHDALAKKLPMTPHPLRIAGDSQAGLVVAA
ncbi:hypothetical protein EUX98_g1643 [Antrodiella citrinella]|uniref:non-specific serine/threonine protein kinase n=1 Tax=Antrodiella citrinella TaxID=2447956 RepID=A0A4S4N9B7_9APHY|nr:hypothetical protein EUX98_g1643 [Antrodiella citrinella]